LPGLANGRDCLFLHFQYPLYGVIIAFKDFNVFEGILKSPWVGTQYFQQYLQDLYFWKIVRNTLLLNIYNLIFSFPAPIILALLLNEVKNRYLKKFVQTVSYMPYFVSTVVLCGIIVNLLSTDGLVNQLIKPLTHQPIQFLLRPEWFRTIYISSGIWQRTGWNSIIYLAALTNIQPELYEAAMVDGANRWKQMIHITLPGIAPTITIMFYYIIINWRRHRSGAVKSQCNSPQKRLIPGYIDQNSPESRRHRYYFWDDTPIDAPVTDIAECWKFLGTPGSPPMPQSAASAAITAPPRTAYPGDRRRRPRLSD
jgi:ABC-type spermidine/putrescine transport system permease subunit II